MEYEKHIKRLVLGYLKNQCHSAYEVFFNHNFKGEKKYIATRIAGQTLMDILSSYSRILDIVQGHLEETDYYNDKSPELSSPMYLVDHLNYLLGENRSNSHSAKILSQESPHFSPRILPHESERSEIDATMECTLPGFSPLSSSNFNHCSKYTNQNMPEKQIEVNSDKNNKKKELVTSKVNGMYDNLWEQETDIKDSHNDSITPIYPSNCCNKLPISSTPEKKSAESEENLLNPDEIISEVLSETLLKKVDFQKKLADTINTVLNSPTGCKESNKDINTKSAHSNNTFIGELEETVKTIMKKTEEDPMFEEMLDEFLGAPIVQTIDKADKEVENDYANRANPCINSMDTVGWSATQSGMSNEYTNVEIIDQQNLLSSNNTNIYVVPPQLPNQQLQLFILNRPFLISPQSSIVNHPPSTIFLSNPICTDSATSLTVPVVTSTSLETPKPLLMKSTKKMNSSKNLFSAKKEKKKAKKSRLKSNSKSKCTENPENNIELAPSWDANLRKLVPHDIPDNKNVASVATKKKLPKKISEKTELESLGEQLELALQATPKKSPKIILPIDEKTDNELSLEMKILSPSKLNASKRNLLSTELESITPNKIIKSSNLIKNINEILETPGKALKETSSNCESILHKVNTPFTPMLRANLKDYVENENSFFISTPDIPITPGYSLQSGNEINTYFVPKETDNDKAIKAMITLEEKKSSVRSVDTDEENGMIDIKGNGKIIKNISLENNKENVANEHIQNRSTESIETEVENTNYEECEWDLQDEFFKISGTNLHRNTNLGNRNLKNSQSKEKEEKVEYRNSQLKICNCMEAQEIIYDEETSVKLKEKLEKPDTAIFDKKIVCAVPLVDGTESLIVISMSEFQSILDISVNYDTSDEECKIYKKRKRSESSDSNTNKKVKVHPLLSGNNIERLLAKIHGPT